jgi:hypothetical protein
MSSVAMRRAFPGRKPELQCGEPAGAATGVNV